MRSLPPVSLTRVATKSAVARPRIFSSRVRRTLAGLLLAAGAFRGLAAEPEPAVVKAGQRLVLVVVENRPEGEAFREEFMSKAVPRARELGQYEVQSFRVDESVSGGRSPHAALWVAWPSPKESEQYRADPVWSREYGPRRTEGWKEMQSFYTDLTEAVTFKLDRTKHYTLAMLWLNDPQTYDEYFAETEALRAELGCRIVFKLPAQRYDTATAGFRPPPQWVILTEWQNHEGPWKYISSETFKRLQAKHDTSIASIEMYRLGFW